MPSPPQGKEAATDYYQIWFNLKNPAGQSSFFREAGVYLDALTQKGVIQAWQAFRRSPKATPSNEGAFNITLTILDRDQFGEQFRQSVMADPGIEIMHNAVVAQVVDPQLALFQDLTDVLDMEEE